MITISNGNQPLFAARLPDAGNPASSPTPTREALKAKFLESLPLRARSDNSLRETVLALNALGTPRSTLVRWAVEAGYSLGYARSFLSRLFRSLGLSLRRTGACRKKDPAALALLESLRQQYGRARARSLLRAALRADQEQETGEPKTERPAIAVLQLRSSAYCGTTIENNPPSPLPTTRIPLF